MNPGASWAKLAAKEPMAGPSITPALVAAVQADVSTSAGVELVIDAPAGLLIDADRAVAERPGPVPELVDGDGLGALFNRGDEDGLVRSVRETLALGTDSAAAAACSAATRSAVAVPNRARFRRTRH